MQRRYTWAVFNQSQSRTFQKMLESLADEVGCCFLYSGTSFPTGAGNMTIVAAPRYVRSSIPVRALSWLKYLVGAAYYLLQLPAGVFVLATTNPPFLPHLVWVFCKLLHKPYGILVWDIYPDYLIEIGWFKPSSWLVQLWRKLNCKAFGEAAFVVTVGENMASVLRRHLQHDAAPRSIQVIPNWADTSWLRPISKEGNPFALAHNQEKKITVLYSGNMGAAFGIEAVADAACILKDRTNISFLLIGDGLGRRQLEERVRQLRLQNVLVLPLQPLETVPYSLATGDICLVLQSPVASDLMLPSKTYDLIAAGCAVIACTPSTSDLARTVTEHSLGVVCPPMDAKALASAIEQLIDNPLWLANCRVRARAAAVDCYSERVAVLHWRNLLTSALETRQEC